MAKYLNSSHGVVSARKARARNVRLVRALSFIIIVCLAFVGGFLVRGETTFLTSLGLIWSDDASLSSSSDSGTGDVYESLSARLNEVELLLEEDSLDTYDLDTATEYVLNAYSLSTDDPYVHYYDEASYAAIVQETSSNYAGIGVLFSEYEGSTYAVDVFEGSVAQAADVRSGDFVVAIDGVRKDSWTVAEVTAALNRDEGEDVVITWSRGETLDDENGYEFTTSLTCSDFTVENVTTALYDTVGYIQLKQITQNSDELIQAALEDLIEQGAQSFVLDLRDNPGGYLTQAVDIASLFIASGTIVKIETQDAEVTTKNATGNLITDLPLVVLVNGNTGAAAEVLAAALQDNQRATLVGTTTLGKGSVQVTRELSFGGAFSYTAAYYKSPSGYEIDGVGVSPDISVSLSDESDNQLTIALETAESLVEG